MLSNKNKAAKDNSASVFDFLSKFIHQEILPNHKKC